MDNMRSDEVSNEIRRKYGLNNKQSTLEKIGRMVARRIEEKPVEGNKGVYVWSPDVRCNGEPLQLCNRYDKE